MRAQHYGVPESKYMDFQTLIQQFIPLLGFLLVGFGALCCIAHCCRSEKQEEREKQFGSGRISSDDTLRKKSGSKRKVKEKKKKKSKYGSNLSPSEDDSNFGPLENQQSPLPPKPGPGAVSPPKPTTTILTTFKKVMQKGLKVKIHDGNKVTKGKIWIIETTLCWAPLNVFGRSKTKAKNELDLRKVIAVEVGMKTGNFQSVKNKKPQEELCLSLRFRESEVPTLDIQVYEFLEREALVEGFNMLLQEMKDLDV